MASAGTDDPLSCPPQGCLNAVSKLHYLAQAPPGGLCQWDLRVVLEEESKEKQKGKI